MNEFIAGMVEKAKVTPQRICFPESFSADILKTAAEVIRTKIGTPVLIGGRFVLGFRYSRWRALHTPLALAAGLAALDLFRERRPDRTEGKDKSEKLRKAQNRAVDFGFFFLSLTIVLGAVWANAAWGAYWSWDPKETWALITWIIYAIYLHRRSRIGKRQAELLLILGFALVIFTFFGTNYLMKGLHSYAG